MTDTKCETTCQTPCSHPSNGTICPFPEFAWKYPSCRWSLRLATQLPTRYDIRILRITDAERVDVHMTGTLTAEDLLSMEVGRFDYSIAPSGRITGTLGLLPGQAGYWELSFTNARWELVNS